MSTIIRVRVSKPNPKGSLEPPEETVKVMECKTPSFKIVVRTDSAFTESNEKVIVISDINQKEQSIEDYVTNVFEEMKVNYETEFGIAPNEFLFKEIPEWHKK